jgi:metallo-beta-lactamase family protein
VLIDCGLFQGFKALRERNWQDLPISANELSAVLLTHAHIDHSGYIPKLVKSGFKGPIYSSQATFELCKILLPDSGFLQEEDARLANMYAYSKHVPALPLYTKEDAVKALQQFKMVQWGKSYSINEDLSVTWSHAGHILGAATVLCHCDNASILFSGDLGRQRDPIMNPPATIQFADYLVLESTYGNHLHAKEDPMLEIAKIINKTMGRGGSLLIPAFAVGRAQSLLYYIYQLKAQNKIPNVPVFLDSPMAINASNLMAKFVKEHKLGEALAAAVCNVATYANTPEESDMIHSNPMPKIIISASGMATGGRVLKHLKIMAPDPKNCIFLTGFQAADTRGEKLLKGAKELKIHGQMVPVSAEVASISSLSAHADYEEILYWLRGFVKAPRKTFITHGEPESSEALKQRIEKELGWECVVPEYKQTFEL